MKLGEWYEMHRQESRKGGALISAHFVDDWHGKPKKVYCDCVAQYWGEVFAECDIISEEAGETESQDISLSGRPGRKYKIRYYHAEIDGDQANLALGRKPPEPRKKTAAKGKAKAKGRRKFTL